MEKFIFTYKGRTIFVTVKMATRYMEEIGYTDLAAAARSAAGDKYVKQYGGHTTQSDYFTFVSGPGEKN